MKENFPPIFVPADFAGLSKADQKVHEESNQPPLKPRKFARSSLKTARKYWELENPKGETD